MDFRTPLMLLNKYIPKPFSNLFEMEIIKLKLKLSQIRSLNTIIYNFLGDSADEHKFFVNLLKLTLKDLMSQTLKKAYNMWELTLN